MTLKRCKQCHLLALSSAHRCPICGALWHSLFTTGATIFLLYVGAACLVVVLAFLVAVDPRP